MLSFRLNNRFIAKFVWTCVTFSWSMRGNTHDAGEVTHNAFYELQEIQSMEYPEWWRNSQDCIHCKQYTFPIDNILISTNTWRATLLPAHTEWWWANSWITPTPHIKPSIVYRGGAWQNGCSGISRQQSGLLDSQGWMRGSVAISSQPSLPSWAKWYGDMLHTYMLA